MLLQIVTVIVIGSDRIMIGIDHVGPQHCVAAKSAPDEFVASSWQANKH
jgi:hypothetical protein